jgi:hypothetical protein
MYFTQNNKIFLGFFKDICPRLLNSAGKGGKI